MDHRLSVRLRAMAILQRVEHLREKLPHPVLGHELALLRRALNDALERAARAVLHVDAQGARAGVWVCGERVRDVGHDVLMQEGFEDLSADERLDQIWVAQDSREWLDQGDVQFGAR